MQVGQNVSGVYLGVSFRGIIISVRRLSVPTDGCFEFGVQLSTPMSSYGYTREINDLLLIYTKYDGSPSSYTKYDVMMGLYEG